MGTTRPANGPDTVVLIHGLWLTGKSWEGWKARYEARGYTVIAESWPGMEGDVSALRDDPSGLEQLGIAEIVDHYAGIVSALDRPPIIMGHSFGGAFTEILLDRGLGAAGVAIDAAAVKGITKLPLSTLKSAWPVLKNPANRHETVMLAPEEFHYAFTNTMSEEDSATAYERYHVPAPGRWVWDGILANVTPGHQDTWVDYHNADRAPLLFIAGGSDHIMPPAVNQSNAEKYEKSGAHTDYHVFEGRDHFTCGAPGWEAVAHYALTWAEEHAPLSARKPSVEAPS
jgi:pimeloyl-ACP methyl ester carboxylesterase